MIYRRSSSHHGSSLDLSSPERNTKCPQCLLSACRFLFYHAIRRTPAPRMHVDGERALGGFSRFIHHVSLAADILFRSRPDPIYRRRHSASDLFHDPDISHHFGGGRGAVCYFDFMAGLERQIRQAPTDRQADLSYLGLCIRYGRGRVSDALPVLSGAVNSCVKKRYG